MVEATECARELISVGEPGINSADATRLIGSYLDWKREQREQLESDFPHAAKVKGLNLPYGGLNGIHVLLASAPSECDMINDADGKIVMLSQAWIEHPHRLAAVMEELRTWEDFYPAPLGVRTDPIAVMLRMAELVCAPGQTWAEDEKDEDPDVIPPFEYISATPYGGILRRLKRALTENFPPLVALKGYQYEDELTVATPPLAQSASDAKEMADALIAAKGDRAAIVNPDSVAVDAFVKNGWFSKELDCGVLCTTYSSP